MVESVSHTPQPDGTTVYAVDGEPVNRQTYLEARAELLLRDVRRGYRRLGERLDLLEAQLIELFAETEC